MISMRMGPKAPEAPFRVLGFQDFREFSYKKRGLWFQGGGAEGPGGSRKGFRVLGFQDFREFSSKRDFS